MHPGSDMPELVMWRFLGKEVQRIAGGAEIAARRPE
jgi:hypothetical protein